MRTCVNCSNEGSRGRCTLLRRSEVALSQVPELSRSRVHCLCLDSLNTRERKTRPYYVAVDGKLLREKACLL